MDDRQWLAEQFEDSRAHLRAVAYRMLGSMSDAEDAVQESWLRLSRSDVGAVSNLRGWLTADGATYLYDHQLDHYNDAFWPTVDPSCETIRPTAVSSISQPRPHASPSSPMSGTST